jgi:integrase
VGGSGISFLSLSTEHRLVLICFAEPGHRPLDLLQVHNSLHRFRDTFAVELLLAGVPLERVSVLLGHSSIKVTEKHYSPWIRERQEQAEADVKRTWAEDPLALLESKGTLEVHGKRSTLN